MHDAVGRTAQFEALQRAFQARLKSLCSRYNSISEVSRACGLNRQQLNRYLNGDGLPSVVTLKSMAEFFDVRVDDFFTIDDAPRAISQRPDIFRVEQTGDWREMAPGNYLEVAASELNEDHLVVGLSVVEPAEPLARYRRRTPALHEAVDTDRTWLYEGHVLPAPLCTLIVYINASMKKSGGAYLLQRDNLSDPDMIGVKTASGASIGGEPVAAIVMFHHIGNSLEIVDEVGGLGVHPIAGCTGLLRDLYARMREQGSNHDELLRLNRY